MQNLTQYKKIFVAGHAGMVGSAIIRALQKKGVGDNIITRSRQELDLLDNQATQKFFATEKPDCVFFTAAKVGGIGANMTYPAEFIYDNLTIQNNVIHNAYANGAKKLVFLASSAIYPKDATIPIDENALLSGYLEPSNSPYAIAKIAGIKMCQAYRTQYNFDAISIIPCNLYGLGDTYDPEKSHVLPSMIYKFHMAKKHNKPTVTLWGSGKPLREFLFSEDAGEGIVYMCENYADLSPLNLGSGTDITIYDLAHLVKQVVEYTGDIIFDTQKSDGVYRKLLNNAQAEKLGWQAQYSLHAGITQTYQDFLSVQK